MSGDGHPLPLQDSLGPHLPLRRLRRGAGLKRDGPEVEELTGQRWVPVLVHGDEVISDSHRILEYLNWLQTQEVA